MHRKRTCFTVCLRCREGVVICRGSKFIRIIRFEDVSDGELYGGGEVTGVTTVEDASDERGWSRVHGWDAGDPGWRRATGLDKNFPPNVKGLLFVGKRGRGKKGNSNGGFIVTQEAL